MLGKIFGKKSYHLELSEDEIAAIPEPSAPAAQAAPPQPAAVQSEGPADPAVESKQGAAPAPAASAPAASMSDPVEIIRTALAAAANKPSASESEPVPTFDYTTPVATASRRRPGPSMSPFKTMAKDMRKTTSGF